MRLRCRSEGPGESGSSSQVSSGPSNGLIILVGWAQSVFGNWRGQRACWTKTARKKNSGNTIVDGEVGEKLQNRSATRSRGIRCLEGNGQLQASTRARHDVELMDTAAKSVRPPS